MHAAIESRARLTLHAIKRHSELLIAALDGALVELSPECVRWGAVCDPQPWMVRAPRMPGSERSSLRSEITILSHRYVAAARELESFIVNGAASCEGEYKAQLRDDVQTTSNSLCAALGRWLDPDAPENASPMPTKLFPQYVPRAVPRAGKDELFFAASASCSRCSCSDVRYSGDTPCDE